MSPSKILIGQFILVLIIILSANWFATQWTAHSLGYQPALGPPWFVAGGYPVYVPWRLYQWWYAYEGYAPGLFARAGAMAAGGGGLGIVAAIAGSLWRARWDRNVTTYGSARWAGRQDIHRGGLFRPAGVFLGSWRGRYLRHDGPEHVLAVAPTRSGKGVGLVVPTLLSWTGSCVVHDIKGENWELTSGWRSRLGPCIRFDPTDRSSPRYNPLLEVRKGEFEVRDAQNIADILIDPEGTAERRDHWDRTGYALLVAVILHVLHAEEDKSLAGCARFLAHPDRTLFQTLERMRTTHHIAGPDGKGCVHPKVAEGARAMLNKSENERSGVLSTTLTLLEVYTDPVIAALTSASDWGVTDLVRADQPVSLYLVVPPSDISRTRPLIRLILNQIGRRLTEELPDASRRKVLLMLDEFPALGRLDFFETALAFLAGYGIRAFLIAQSLNQIEKAYGPNNSILDNCHVRVVFATNDERTAKRISDTLGTMTDLRSQKNYTGNRLSLWLPHIMLSRQETQRGLLTPGEVLQLPADAEVIMISGMPPIRAKKLRYFRDRNFTDRVAAPAAREGVRLAAPAIWTRAGSAAGRPGSHHATGAEEGGRAIQTALDLVPSAQGSPETPDLAPESDDGPDPAPPDPGSLARRATGLDRADDDLLPGF